MMHARSILPHKTKQLPNSFGLTRLAPVAWHKLHLSLYITSRMLFVLNLSQSWLTYLQKINTYKYVNIHDWTLRASTHERPPCVLRHMGNAYAIAHIFTHTSPSTIEMMPMRLTLHGQRCIRYRGNVFTSRTNRLTGRPRVNVPQGTRS